MKYTYDETTLTIEADESERAALREVATDLPDHYGTHGHEVEFMEGLICNSELDWINPADTGDLTDAPMLGILGAEFSESSRDGVVIENLYGWHHVGRWKNEETDELENHYQPILHRWGYPHYQLRSFLTDLMETGKAVFLPSW